MSITHVNNAQMILDGILDIFETVEESSNGRAFYPTKLSTCRVMHGVKLNELFEKARKELKRPIPPTLAERNAEWNGSIREDPVPLSEEFRNGAKAMFDALSFRAANNYHERPAMQEKCDKENELIEAWALDALKEISPDDHRGWMAINDAYDSGIHQGKLTGMLEGRLAAQEHLKALEISKMNFWQRLVYVFTGQPTKKSNTGT